MCCATFGRYTHRMAISNHRLTAFDGEHVSFRWRDYAHGSKQRVMPLDAVEFLRRFFLHVLPKGFVRIRHYGLLSNRFRKQLLPWRAHTPRRPGPRATPFAALAQLRTPGEPPLRRTHARHPALHRRSTLFRRLRFLMTTGTNPALGLAPGMPSHSCVQPPCQRCLCAVSRAQGSFDPRQLIREATNFHHHRCRSRLSDPLARSPNRIQNP